MLPKRCRLTSSRDFARVQARGRKWVGRHLVVRALPADEPQQHMRLGVGVSTKVGSSVVRNKVKRRIREAFRAVCAGQEVGLDVVISARPSASSATWAEILAETTAGIEACVSQKSRPQDRRREWSKR